MKRNSSLSNKKYMLLLAGSLLASIALFFFLRGTVNLTVFNQTVKNPTDSEDNLAYGNKYHPSSGHVLERDHIAIKSFGSELKAQDLETGIYAKAGSIAEKSGYAICRFSEYAGYFYMFDGKNVYRSAVNTPEQLRITVEACRKFEPMGNYLYSLKEHNGESRLFRCSITGTYEKILFQDVVEDFWASDGNLFMKIPNGRYRWYNIISQNNLEHTLPKYAHNVSLDGDCIFYLAGTEEMIVYQRSCNSFVDIALPFSPVVSYNAADGKVGLLIAKPDGSVQAAWCQRDGSEAEIFEGYSFSPKSVVDITAERIFVTENDGTTWATSLDNEEWFRLFDDADTK